MEVRDYVIRRVLFLVPTLLLISLATFTLTRISGSPIGMYASISSSPEQIAEIREALHLNEPIYVQYFYWLKETLSGNLGWSSEAAAPVTKAIALKAPASFELAIAAIFVAVFIAVTLGTLAGRYEDTWIDHASRMLAVGGMSTPAFWAALLLIYAGYVKFGFFPLGRASPELWDAIPHPTGFYTVDSLLAGNLQAFGDAVWHLMLPALVAGYAESAVITRQLRSEMVEKKHKEFVNAARARGVSERTVFGRHIRRNALIPTVTVAGLSFAFLMRGIVVVELVFNWPGLGRWVANAALSGDYAAIMGFILLIAVMVVTINLVVDVLYAYLDPRVELGE